MAALGFAGRGDMARLDLSADQLRDAPAIQDSDAVRLQSDMDWQRSIAAYYEITLAPEVPAAPGSHGAARCCGARRPDAAIGASRHPAG